MLRRQCASLRPFYIKGRYTGTRGLRNTSISFFTSNLRCSGAGAAAVDSIPQAKETHTWNTDTKAERLPPVSISAPITIYPPPHVTEYKPLPALTPSRLLKVYSELSKARLTFLNVLTAMAGVALCPLPTTVPVLLATA
ncbi:Protoheme IX farnesyltransferase, mitochondrial, partial [Tulasnella sp. 418]